MPGMSATSPSSGAGSVVTVKFVSGQLTNFLLGVSASLTPNAPVPGESNLLSHEEAARTDRQLCQTSRSCCCTAVAQRQKWHPQRCSQPARYRR